MLAFVIVAASIGQENRRRSRFRHLRVFNDVVDLVVSNYVEDVKVDKAMEGRCVASRTGWTRIRRISMPRSPGGRWQRGAAGW